MYTIFDLETSTKESYKRKANPFDADNYIVATGIKHKGNGCETYYMEEAPASWLDNTKILVGHNLGFDLSWSWRSAPLKAYLKRGGKIWCTQYAEYILTGQQAQWASLNECSEKYGGTQKVDEIKAMWQAGIDTIDIPKGMLLDYLDDDLNNTEIVYLAQVAQAKKLGMLKSLFSHMEALLGLTEMECNGLYIDQPTAEKQQAELEAKLEIVIETLQEYIPKDLPAELEWNWSSKDHLSALLFGGSIKYKKRLPRLDEFGNNTYTKKKESWPVMGGVAVDPDVFTDSTRYDTYKGGAKAGSIKYKKVDVQGELKTSLQELTFDVQPWYTPKSEWETKKEGVYKTDEEVLNQIKESDSDLAGTMLQWRVLDKYLGTYYKRFDAKKKVDVGMLTCIQPDGKIHHKLNNVATVTGRLSSSDPNLQTLPRSGASGIKRMFASRLGEEGVMAEIDFSSMEVVGQGMLTQDPQLLADIESGIDFHCSRGAKKLGVTYEEFLHKAKVEEDPLYVAMRQDAKSFSFERSYGAGAASISLSTGIHIDDVKELIRLEEETYSGIVDYNERVKGEVLGNRRPTKVQLEVDGMTFNQGRGWHVSPTGKRYVFKEQIAPPFMRNPRNRKQAPVYTSFSPTQMKNYSVQGICGEIMLMCIGIAFREFNKRDNFGGRALLVNTVHDCIWLDCHKDVYKEAVTLLYGIMTSAHKYIEDRYGFKPNVIFRAEAETGPNMLELHKFKLED